MLKAVEITRPTVSGRWLNVIADPDETTIRAMYGPSGRPKDWAALTTIPQFEKMWVGTDAYTCGKTVNNSMLVKLRSGVYMYLGQEVVTFRPTDEISDYVAIEGAGRTPFSVAFGSDHLYFLTEHAYVTYEEVMRFEDEQSVSKDRVRDRGAGDLYRLLYRMMSNKEYEVLVLPLMSKMM